MPAIAVVGATSWGLTLSALLARVGAEVTIVCRNEAEAEEIAARRGIARLPQLVLPAQVAFTSARRLPANLEGLVFAVPAQTLAQNLASGDWLRGLPVLSAAKGIEQATGRRMSEVLVAGGWSEDRVAVLSGPNLSHEIAQGKPAAAVVAGASPVLAEWWQTALSSAFFRVYTSDDVVGVELGGALKNVVAIAAGAAAGLEFGTNAVAALMTRGLAEITRLGLASGAQSETFLGLSGVGDLAATCFSSLSRNWRFGEMLARGMTATDAIAAIGEAVEGATTAGVAVRLGAEKGIEMPIAAAVAAVAAGESTVIEAVGMLLARPLKAE